MRREGRIPHERYVHEWIECKDPETGEIYRDTKVCYRSKKVACNHSKWDRQHLLCQKLHREKPANKSLACSKGFKNKRGRKSLLGTENPDEGLSDPKALVSLEARGIAEALDKEDHFVLETPDGPLFFMDAFYEETLLTDPNYFPAWSEDQPDEYYQSQAYQLDFPLHVTDTGVCGYRNNGFQQLPRNQPSPTEEGVDLYGTSPESASGICINYSKPITFDRAQEHDYGKAYDAYRASGPAPQSLIPALKYFSSEDVEQAYEKGRDRPERDYSDDEMISSEEQALFTTDEELGIPGPFPVAFSLENKAPMKPFELSDELSSQDSKVDVAMVSAKPEGVLSGSERGSVFGEYEEIGDEEWDVISDEGSFEDEIFEDSDICTISVHYGAN